MTDPAPIKSNIELTYCKYCRGLLLPDIVTKQEIQHGYHLNCHTDIDAYANNFIPYHELVVLQELEVW